MAHICRTQPTFHHNLSDIFISAQFFTLSSPQFSNQSTLIYNLQPSFQGSISRCLQATTPSKFVKMVSLVPCRACLTEALVFFGPGLAVITYLISRAIHRFDSAEIDAYWVFRMVWVSIAAALWMCMICPILYTCFRAPWNNHSPLFALLRWYLSAALHETEPYLAIFCQLLDLGTPTRHWHVQEIIGIEIWILIRGFVIDFLDFFLTVLDVIHWDLRPALEDLNLRHRVVESFHSLVQPK